VLSNYRPLVFYLPKEAGMGSIDTYWKALKKIVVTASVRNALTKAVNATASGDNE
jgi:hypothetical protein